MYSCGIWAKNGNPIVLGHNRLSIIELSEAGAQPCSLQTVAG